MGRVADALKRAGELRRDGTGDELPVELDFHTELRFQTPAPGRPPAPPVPYLPSASLEAVVERRITPASPLLLGNLNDHVAEEEYRTLAALMHRAQERARVRTVLITSALPQEGKSLTTANLAIMLSRSFHRRVLVIDGDLRKPSLHQLFGGSARPGLTDALLAEVPVAPVHIDERLWFVPAGSPPLDSSHVVTGEAMKRLLDQAAEEFDWVLLDTPPLRVLPDAQLLSAHVDAAILVVHAGKTSYDACRPAAEILSENGKLLGVVLNRGDRRRTPADYAAYTGQRGR